MEESLILDFVIWIIECATMKQFIPSNTICRLSGDYNTTSQMITTLLLDQASIPPDMQPTRALADLQIIRTRTPLGEDIKKYREMRICASFKQTIPIEMIRNHGCTRSQIHDNSGQRASPITALLRSHRLRQNIRFLSFYGMNVFAM